MASIKDDYDELSYNKSKKITQKVVYPTLSPTHLTTERK